MTRRNIERNLSELRSFWSALLVLAQLRLMCALTTETMVRRHLAARHTGMLMCRRTRARIRNPFHSHHRWLGTVQGITRQTYCGYQSAIPTTTRFPTVLPQSVFGHRLHAHASNDPDQTANTSDKRRRDSFLASIRQRMCREVFPQLMEKKSTNIENSPVVVILLAVSGGCDSVGLLHAMLKLMTPIHRQEIDPNASNGMFQFSCDENGGTGPLCEVHVVHFDHQQRGAESDEDRLFVEDLCRQRNLSFHCYFWNRDISQGSERSFSQEVARDWRRSKMCSLLEELTVGGSRPGVMLTAHHKDDSIETLLLKLLRGAHITDLSGIDVLTGIGGSQQGDGVFAKPMIDVRKEDVIHFLGSHDLVWREDASNASNKYKRNRVRNELIPLLSDIVGGEDILQKRLDNLSQQSSEVKMDLSCRAQQYLDQSTDGTTSFALPPGNEVLNIVYKQALHSWANSLMGNQSFTYEQLTRVCSQLADYPENRVWTLSIGGGWNMIRNGDLLELNRQGESQDDSELQPTDADGQISWSLVDAATSRETANAKDPRRSELKDLMIQVPASVSEPSFVLSDVASNEGLLFLPPWLQNRRPMKLREFLRGQKVPLHRRKVAPLIVCRGEGSQVYAAAVFVENKGEWIAHADFDSKSEEEGTAITLHL